MFTSTYFSSQRPARAARLVANVFALGALVLSTLAFTANPAEAAACQTYHTVKSGETLYKIGLKYNFLWTTIAKANNLKGEKVLAGQVLCIPEKGTPPPSTTPAPQLAPRPQVTPTISISSVVKDQTVTIQTANFPAKQKFTARIGQYGTLGVNGTAVATTDSGNGGSFSVTYTIPAALRGQNRLALRLESADGYYSYNWFWNNSTN